VYGDEANTYGPFTVDEIKQAVLDGNLARTSYVWSQGMNEWIYLYQIPGFDRRTVRGPSAPGAKKTGPGFPPPSGGKIPA
jgi:hypothetical protein